MFRGCHAFLLRLLESYFQSGRSASEAAARQRWTEFCQRVALVKNPV
jgi:hypothetical protein